MRRQAAGAPKQAEGRNLPQHIVGDDSWRCFDLLAAENADARRHVPQPLLAARRGDRHFVEQRRRSEPDFDRSAGLPMVLRNKVGDLLRETWRTHDDVANGGGHDGLEAPLGRGRRAHLGSALRGPHDDRRSGYDGAARIAYDARQRHHARCGRLKRQRKRERHGGRHHRPPLLDVFDPASANATSAASSPCPVATTTNWRPAFVRYVIGVALVRRARVARHTSAPVLMSSA